MSQQTTFSLQEVSELLHVAPQRLRQWEESFPLAFGDATYQARTRYSQTDLATLLVIQRFLENGYSAEQISQHLNGQTPTRSPDSAEPAETDHTAFAAAAEQTSTVEPASATVHSAAQPQTKKPSPNHVAEPRVDSHAAVATQFPVEDAGHTPAAPETFANVVATLGESKPDAASSYLPEPYSASAEIQPVHEMLGEMLGTVANSQQSMLNIQDSIREMLGVIVQDNFNLKTENRKLRDRMLELERALAEYQRREETRKERLEGRLRAVESTLSAMQQQLAQLVQLQRQKAKRNRFW